MTQQRPDDIHQAFFGWSHDYNEVGLIAFSFNQREEAQAWQRKLEEHIRLQPHGADRPKSSLTYLDLEDGNTAVLRRVASGHTPGRNNSHALIGPADTLDVRVALGLMNWEGWLTDAPSERYLDSFGASYIASFAGHTEQLRQPAKQNESGGLALVLPRLLDHPDQPLSIVGCPHQERLAMVWGLYSGADDYLKDCGIQRRWTFSTHEVRHDDSIKWLPEIVFLPTKPGGAGVVSRTIIDLNADPLPSNSRLLASQLLATLFNGTPRPVAKPVREPALASAGAPVRDGSPPPQSHQGPFEQRSSAHAAAPVAPQPTERHRTDALVRATSIRDFESGLAALAESTQFPGDRQRLRAELDLAGMNKATEFVERKARLEWFDRLLKITYGPNLEDLGQADGFEHATKLINQSQSDVLSMMLGRAAARRPSGPIRDAALDRAATGPRLAAQIPAHRPTRRTRGNQLLPYLAAILLLGLVFLLGILVGRPGPAPQNSAPPTAAPPAGPAAQKPEETARPPVLPSNPLATIRVEASQEPAQVIFAFVAYGGALYPQAPCTLQGDGTWVCIQNRLPPGSKAVSDTKLQAFRVPQKDDSRLRQAANENNSVEKESSWGTPLPEQR